MDIIRTLMASMNLDPLMVLVQVCLFYVFHMLMCQVLYKPLAAARRERGSVTLDKVAKAKVLNEETIKIKNEYEEKVRVARREALETVQAAQKQAAELRQSKLDEAKSQAEAIIEKTKAEIETERLRLSSELRSAVPQLAEAAAVRILSGVTGDSGRAKALSLAKAVSLPKESV